MWAAHKPLAGKGHLTADGPAPERDAAGEHPARHAAAQRPYGPEVPSVEGYRSPRAATATAEPALPSPARSSPAGVRAARTAVSRLRSGKGHAAAGTVGSSASRSRFGASPEGRGPGVVLHRAAARRAGRFRGPGPSRRSGSSAAAPPASRGG